MTAQIIAIAAVGLFGLWSSPSAADSASAPTPTARPATAEDFTERFARREQLSAKDSAAFRRILADARVSAQKLKNPTIDEKRQILKNARKNVAQFLDEKQLKDFDGVGWGLLFCRAEPGDENPIDFLKRPREERGDRFFHALP